MARSLLLPLLALLFSAVPWRAVASVLVVQAGAEAQRQSGEGAPVALMPQVKLFPGDRLRTGANGWLDLALGRHGVLELGGLTQLTLERVPFATFATDLQTRLRLDEGYLRVIWKHPELSLRWPLVVDLGPFRVSLTSGEYFFETLERQPVLCVAEGEVAVTTPGQPQPLPLAGPACYRLLSGAPAQPASVSLAAFVPVRADRQLTALAEATGLRLAGVAPAAPPAPTTQPGFREPMEAAIDGAPPATPPTAVARTAPVTMPSAPLAEPTPPSRAMAPDPPSVRSSPPPGPPVSPPARPAPTAAPTASPAAGRWALNVASLSSREAAERVQRELRARGFEPVIVTAEVQGRTWHRVQFTGLPDAASARALGERLAAETGYKQAWVVPP